MMLNDAKRQKFKDMFGRKEKIMYNVHIVQHCTAEWGPVNPTRSDRVSGQRPQRKVEY